MISFWFALFFLFLVALIGGMMTLSQITGFLNGLRLRAKFSRMEQMSKDGFIKYYAEQGFSSELVSDLYDEIMKSVPKKGFSIHPDHNLSRDYFLSVDYLKDLSIKLFRKHNGRSPLIVEERNLAIHAPMSTFEKILIFASNKY